MFLALFFQPIETGASFVYQVKLLVRYSTKDNTPASLLIPRIDSRLVSCDLSSASMYNGAVPGILSSGCSYFGFHASHDVTACVLVFLKDEGLLLRDS